MLLRTLAIAALCGFAAPALAAELPARDAAALTDLAAEADAAWNQRDTTRMTAVYASNGSLLVAPMSAAREGQPAIGEYIARAFARRQGEWRHITRLTRMEALTPDLAMTDSVVDVDQRQPDGSWKTMRRFNNVSMAEREGAGWRIRAVRAFPMP